MNRNHPSTKLDWNLMLGFEQIAEERDSIRQEVSRMLSPKVGRKVGDKVGVKLGGKIGEKSGTKISASWGSRQVSRA